MGCTTYGTQAGTACCPAGTAHGEELPAASCVLGAHGFCLCVRLTTTHVPPSCSGAGTGALQARTHRSMARLRLRLRPRRVQRRQSALCLTRVGVSCSAAGGTGGDAPGGNGFPVSSYAIHCARVAQPVSPRCTESIRGKNLKPPPPAAVTTVCMSTLVGALLVCCGVPRVPYPSIAVVLCRRRAGCRFQVRQECRPILGRYLVTRGPGEDL